MAGRNRPRLQACPAELRRVRREAGVRRGADPGPRAPAVAGGDSGSACMVCEDMWSEDVAEALPRAARRCSSCPTARRSSTASTTSACNWRVARVTETGLPLLYVNQVGGQDELVFDGGSFALDAERRLVAQAPGISRTWRSRAGARRERPGAAARGAIAPPLPELEAIYRAMVLGLPTTSTRTAFRAWCSACRAASTRRSRPAVAVDALGHERVHAVMMPSRYTASESLEDAEVRRRLGIRLDSDPDRAGGRRASDHARAPIRGPAARHHRGEHPVARPRRDPDGDLEQARPDGADHRQQVGDVGRLRHPLRRHVRRLFRAQGPLQDRRVRAGPLAQRGAAPCARPAGR